MKTLKIELTKKEAELLNDLLSMELISLGFSESEDVKLGNVLNKLEQAINPNRPRSHN